MSKEVIQNPVVIVSMARTPMGSFQGCFASLSASVLGAHAIKATVQRAGIDGVDIDEAMIGNVLSAGQGQAPARQAVVGAGLPLSVNCTTINKMCGSAMKATMLAYDSLLAGSNNIVLAGGMESMSNAPYLLSNARSGYRMGHGAVLDHMFVDGLEDAFEKDPSGKGTLMGAFAELCASKYKFSREQQDEFAITSLQRAQHASKAGYFDGEITPVSVSSRRGTASGDTVVEQDEQPFKAQIDKIPHLRAAFKKDGTITAANASSISDGAATLLLMRQDEAQRRGLTPLAKILGHTTHAHAPSWFTTAPVTSLQKLLQKLNWQVDEVDLFEVNEAFAVVTMTAMQELKIAHEKINIHGGACALGHPVGASGARILVTLIAALQRNQLKRGMAALCIGGGEATAMAVELF